MNFRRLSGYKDCERIYKCIYIYYLCIFLILFIFSSLCFLISYILILGINCISYIFGIQIFFKVSAHMHIKESTSPHLYAQIPEENK